MSKGYLGWALLKGGRKVSFGLHVEGWDWNGDAILVATLPDHDLDFYLAETCTLRAYPAALAAISRHFDAEIADSFAPSVRLLAGSRPAALQPDEP